MREHDQAREEWGRRTDRRHLRAVLQFKVGPFLGKDVQALNRAELFFMS
jgi:hypothetical protein